ncbi:MAG: hypothetical protein B6I36_08555 [Desulfobacteraceae bacterium 4572_35.1]|nr:MAG: hypothetical protein B6I36_08555 [Desulfobacteraceae bacterium 4572_35.1]
MDQRQIRQLIEQRSKAQVFVKWYASADDEGQVELVDYFLRSVLDTVQVVKFELLDLEQLWLELLQKSEDRFERVWRQKVEVLDWYFIAANGSEKVRSCCFRPEGLLAIYNEVVGA